MVAAAAWCVVAWGVLLGLAYYVSPARWIDAAALHGFASMDRGRIDSVATVISHLCDPIQYAIASLIVIAIAARVRGARTAAAITMLLIGANATSQLLKPLLAHHREIYYSQWHLNNLADGSYPSGHATAAMTLSLALVIIVPRAYRPLVAAFGVIFTLAVSFSILILVAHFPSDVVGGYLVATAWGLLTFAALGALNERWPQRGTVREAARQALPAPSAGTVAKGAAAAALIAALVSVSRVHQIASFANRHTAATAVASAIAVAAAVLLAAVVAISSRSQSR